jgi:cysteine synthase A
MILDAEARGLLRPGYVIIEPNSGNTGISLAAIAAVRGYRVILTMPETMSPERRKLMQAYGAEIILTEGSLGMRGAIERASEIAAGLEGSFIPGQFHNRANPDSHFTSTGPEIWEDTGGRLDGFVACVGSGGTITGAGDFLKKQNPSVYLAAVEPASSPVLSGGAPERMGFRVSEQDLSPRC